MTLSTIIGNAWTGLSTSQAVMRSISNNISNVNTPGYAREKVHLESLAFAQGGAGVRISQVERVADRYLEAAAHTATADAARYEKMAEFHGRLQGIIGRTDSNGFLATRLDSVFTALADLATQPADAIRRRSAVAEIDRFAEEISRISAEIQALRSDASNQLYDATRTAGDLIARVADLNPLIVREKQLGNVTSGLVEQRNAAINALSELMDVTVSEEIDGSVQLRTGSGLVLLDRAARAFDYSTPGVVGPETVFTPIAVNLVDPETGQQRPTPMTIDGAVSGGRIAGLLALRDRDLPQVAESLGELARVFAHEVNRAHNANVAVPPPASLSGRNTGLLPDDANRFTGRTSFAVLDADGAIAARVEIDFDSFGPDLPLGGIIAAVNAGLSGAGTLSLTNGVMRFETSASGMGVAIVDDAGAPSSRAGMGFSLFFGLNDLITSRSSIVPATGLTLADGHGLEPGGTATLQVRDSANRVITSQTLTITGGSMADLLAELNATSGLGRYVNVGLDAQGRITIADQPGYRGMTVHVVSDSTARGTTGQSMTSFFGLGVGRTAKAAEGLAVRDDIRRNTTRMALARLDPATPPGTVALSVGDARGAQALADLTRIEVGFNAAGNLAGLRATLPTYAGFLLGDAALLGERAQAGLEDATSLRDSVVKRRDDFAGVNLDEELGAMVIYQNSYNASARLISTAREMYDALLGLVQ